MRKQLRVVYIDLEPHVRLKMLAAMQEMTMGQLTTRLVSEEWERVRGNGDASGRAAQGYGEKHEAEVPGTSHDPSAGYNSGVGEAKKREDVLGS